MAKTKDKDPVAEALAKPPGERTLRDWALIPSTGDTLLPPVREARDAAQRGEAERAAAEQRHREIGGRPPEERPIPGDVRQRAMLHQLAAVETIRARGERCQTERAALETELAEARVTHQRNRTARAEAYAAGIVQGNAPRSDEGADRREAETIRELEGRIDGLARAEEQLRVQSIQELARELRERSWPAQRRLRAEGIERMLEGARLLAEGQTHLQAAERAGLQECSRVRQALQLDLGPPARIIAGKPIEKTDPHDRAGHGTVTVGREPDVVERLDDTSSRVVRSYLEDHFIGVSSTFSANWFHRLAPQAVLETIALLESELARLKESEAR